MPRVLLILLGLVLIILSCTDDSLEIDGTDGTIYSENEGNSEPKDSNELLSYDQHTYHWVGQMQYPSGLMESADNTEFVSLYDNALSAMVFTALGDYDKAEKIFDYFNGQIDSELLSGPGGFHQFRDINGENKRRIWLGDNAWLLIALNNYRNYTGNNKYDRLADELEGWIRSLQDEDGGIWGGYNEDGSQIHKVTEGIITAYNAVKGYDDFHRGILKYLKTERWNHEDNLLVAWPDNEDYYYALDLHSLGYMIFEDFPSMSLAKADRYLTQHIATMTGSNVVGYCFDEDKDVVWLEGTAQMALAFQEAGMESQAFDFMHSLGKYAVRTGKSFTTAGLPYTTNQGTNYGEMPLWDHADLQPALSSSIWYLFNILEFHPLALGKNKSVPESDRFW